MIDVGTDFIYPYPAYTFVRIGKLEIFKMHLNDIFFFLRALPTHNSTQFQFEVIGINRN